MLGYSAYEVQFRGSHSDYNWDQAQELPSFHSSTCKQIVLPQSFDYAQFTFFEAINFHSIIILLFRIHHYKYSPCPWQHLLVVVPVVGILSDIQALKPVLNVAEVDKIFDLPLEMFLKDENRTSEKRERMWQTFTVHYFTYEKGNRKNIIWGLTARILIHAASVVYERPPDFPERRVQFNLPKYQKEYSSMPLGSVPARH
ncbi:nudix hydrolase 15, mitochondrial-like [Phragmites australis]|uniref:nudix hydrolase 15, mitochondrial-like n=1 Tax=Phragmites australis TaxID=29695 RepID=UPI002D779B9C|nr:nudix hydrolase 15, mitochondrial-like [Phragmites australis]